MTDKEEALERERLEYIWTVEYDPENEYEKDPEWTDAIEQKERTYYPADGEAFHAFIFSPKDGSIDYYIMSEIVLNLIECT